MRNIVRWLSHPFGDCVPDQIHSLFSTPQQRIAMPLVCLACDLWIVAPASFDVVIGEESPLRPVLMTDGYGAFSCPPGEV